MRSRTAGTPPRTNWTIPSRDSTRPYSILLCVRNRPMLLDNPFRESRLNTSWNFRPEWDVPELNRDITKWLVDEVRRLRGRKEPDPGQMIAVLTGPPGYGK